MRTPRVWMATLTLVATMTTSAHAYDDGLYFSFGFGYANESGDRGIDTVSGGCSVAQGFGPASAPFLWPEGEACIYVPGPNLLPGDLTVDAAMQGRHEEIVRADSGDMIAIQLRLGYNILGYASIEVDLSGAGSTSITDGMAHVGFQGRLHPAQLVTPHDDRDWDVSLFVGGGYSIAGYKPIYDPSLHGGDPDSPELNRDAVFDSKGWTGAHIGFGAGFDYQFSDSGSVGLDLKFIKPLYATWIANFEVPYEAPPVETPDAWVVTPTVRLTWLIWSPEP
jgi:hypothetical protein